jgi:hypothetical protein
MAKFSLGQVPIQVSQFRQDFTFIVGVKQLARYPCSLVAASLYCKTVRLLVLSDPTATFITYPYEDPQSLFNLFMQLLSGQRVQLRDANVASFLYAAANHFQCDDLIEATSKYLQRLLTPEKCFTAIKQCRIPTRCPAEIDFLVSHLPDLIKRPEFCDLPLSVLDALLSSPALLSVDIDEKDIVALVSEIVNKNGPEYFGLFAHIAFDVLDYEETKRFLENVPAADIGGALWLAISERLVKPVQPPEDGDDA